MATTHGQIFADLAPGKFTRIAKVVPSGSLEARRMAGDVVMFYWRYTYQNNSSREVIGVWDSKAKPKDLKPTARGFSVLAAQEAAREMAALHYANLDAGGYAAVMAKRKAEQQKAKQDKQNLSAFTLQSLLTDYVHWLGANGKVSEGKVRTQFKLHVINAWPELAALPANEVTEEQIADILRKMIEAGKVTTAWGLRKMLRAAFQMAREAKTNPAVPIKFKDYALKFNPVNDVKVAGGGGADMNPLTGAEMRAYWQAIKLLDTQQGAVLRLHLLTGGQRLEQLRALKTADVHAAHIVLWDGKGKVGTAPRQHLVPLIPEAKRALEMCNPTGDYALSVKAGEPLGNNTIRLWAQKLPGNQSFKPKRVRSGVETLLASLGVSKEIRGRLQSHGISGVQDRHYNAYEYMKEKEDALSLLFKYLEGSTAPHPAVAR